MTELTQYLITGLAVGMVYSLIALGFALIWKSSSVANLALGQLVLVCSWFSYSMLVQASLPVWAAVISLIVFGLLTAFYKYHRMGIAMRATADDQMAVQACGVPVTTIFSWSWMFACVVAAVEMKLECLRLLELYSA